MHASDHSRTKRKEKKVGIEQIFADFCSEIFKRERERKQTNHNNDVRLHYVFSTVLSPIIYSLQLFYFVSILLVSTDILHLFLFFVFW